MTAVVVFGRTELGREQRIDQGGLSKTRLACAVCQHMSVSLQVPNKLLAYLTDQRPSQ